MYQIYHNWIHPTSAAPLLHPLSPKPQNSLNRYCCGSLLAEIRNSWGNKQEATFYCASTGSADSYTKAELWEQRGLTLYTLASRLQKQKARSNPYMVIFNFIGFTLVLCDSPLPGAVWSDFSGFISLLCHPYLPATFSGLKPRLFSFDPPLCYIIPPFDARTHLGSKSIILM
jgi:hypothetical protein